RIEGRVQVDNRAEDAATDALPRHLGEEVLHRIEPGRRGRGEVKSPARMACQPGQHFRMLVGGVVVEDDVDRLVGGNLALDSVEEADEFDVAGGVHAAADNGGIQDAEGGRTG